MVRPREVYRNNHHSAIFENRRRNTDRWVTLALLLYLVRQPACRELLLTALAEFLRGTEIVQDLFVWAQLHISCKILSGYRGNIGWFSLVTRVILVSRPKLPSPRMVNATCIAQFVRPRTMSSKPSESCLLGRKFSCFLLVCSQQRPTHAHAHDARPP